MQIFDRGNYNYLNNNYNIPTYEQTEDEKYFNPYEGYIRGNLFPKLYNTYKIEVPYEIRPLNEQAEMLTYINSLYFALTDLNLYLDIHPTDKKAINEYINCLNNLKEYMRIYQNTYEPLTNTSEALEAYPWRWIDSWPWECGN